MLFRGKTYSRRMLVLSLVLIFSLALAAPAGAVSQNVSWNYTFSGPLFGLAAAPNGSLLAADAGAGIVELRKGSGRVLAALPGISDMAPVGPGTQWAVTGGGEGDLAARLWWVVKGEPTEIANLFAFEAEVNPAGGEVDSNPFDVAALPGGRALVADAGGNSLLIADMQGNLDWVATFPPELVSTENIKQLLGCPNPELPPDLAFACDLPEMMPAEAVPTSVVVGPDGAFYVGELKGFPGPHGMSRIWRVKPDALHAECGGSPDCSVVASGFTSIVDMTFGPDGTLYVVEMDENSFMAVELGFMGLEGALAGGTVNACDISTWSCTELATGLFVVTSVAVDAAGQVYAAVSALLPDARIITIP